MPEEDPKKTDTTGDKGDRDAEQDAGRDQDIDQQITDNLRKLYQSTVDENLPPSLQELIDRLKAQDDGNG